MHSKAKGFLCDLQHVADGDGWVTAEDADVLMGDLKPLPVGIIDLRERKQPYRQCECGLISRSNVRTLLCIYLFLSSFVLYSICIKHALIKTAFEIDLTGLDLSHKSSGAV